MIAVINALQAGPWVPSMVLGLGVAFVVWRINARWAKEAAETDIRAKEHELTKISTSNAVTTIEHKGR